MFASCAQKCFWAWVGAEQRNILLHSARFLNRRSSTSLDVNFLTLYKYISFQLTLQPIWMFHSRPSSSEIWGGCLWMLRFTLSPSPPAWKRIAPSHLLSKHSHKLSVDPDFLHGKKACTYTVQQYTAAFVILLKLKRSQHLWLVQSVSVIFQVRAQPW